MTEIKSKFLELTKVALVEFAINHPGTKVVANILNEAMNIDEQKLLNALEETVVISIKDRKTKRAKTLPDVVDEFIKYSFTGGREPFSKPSWLKNDEELLLEKRLKSKSDSVSEESESNKTK